jgi:hypothetical protein
VVGRHGGADYIPVKSYADLCTEDGSAVDGRDDFRSEGMVRSP